MSTALCDDEAFGPVRRLVEGPLENLDDLDRIEQFARVVLLHDEIILEVMPIAYDPAWSEELNTGQSSSGLRGFVTGQTNYGQIHRYLIAGTCGSTNGYEFFGPLTRKVPEIDLAAPLLELARRNSVKLGEGFNSDSMELPGTGPNESNRLTERFDFVPDQVADDAGIRVLGRGSTTKRTISILADHPGDDARVALEFYLEFLKRIIGTFQRGGSLLFDGQFAREAIQLASRYPAALFQELDKSWQDYAQRIERQGLPFSVPPVLGIILNRSANRDAIPYVIRDLREDEWADARKKVWHLLDSLRTAQIIGRGTQNRGRIVRSVEAICIRDHGN